MSRKSQPQTKRNPKPHTPGSAPRHTTPRQTAQRESASKQPAARESSLLDHPWVAPALLAIFTFAVYARSLAVPIIGGDDYVYFFRDARLEHLSPEKIWRILTQPFFANFHPFTTMTFAIDRAVWGSWVPGFHITHLLYYAGGVVGLYFLFARVLRSRPAALLAAALYAAHTVHVESVAWLASRKDVVCLFFYVMALLAYVKYAASARGGWGAYAASIVLAGIAMLSKGYAVALPAVLLAYDLCFTPRLTRRQLLDKVPFFALAGATILLTVHAQDRDSALIQVAMTGEQRLALLAKVFALYVGHALLPIHLSAFYTVGGQPVEGPIVLLGVVLAAGLVAAFFFLRRSQPAIAFGIALFLAPMATVMNFFFTLRIWMTDRYLFFPTIGSSLAIIAVAMALSRAGAPAASRRGHTLRPAAKAAAIALIGLYALLTVARIGVWTSAVTLWSDTLRKELHLPGSGPVTANDFADRTTLGAGAGAPLMSLVESYRTAGMNAEADSLAEVHNRVSGGGGEYSELALARKDLEAGKWDDVIARLKPLAESKGSWLAPDATLLIGVAEAHRGDAQASQQMIQHAFDLYREKGRPVTDAELTLGTMEFRSRNYPKAIEWYRSAFRESNQDAKAAFHLGRALEENGQIPEAMQLYQKIAKGDYPVLPESEFTILDVYLQMAVAAQRIGRPEEAIGYFQEVLRRSPDHPKRAAIEAQIAGLKTAPNLAIGAMEFGAGNYAKAIPWYRAAVRESPRDARPAFFLGRALEESGQVTEAMQLYKRIAGGDLAIGPGSEFTVLDVYLQMGVASQKLGRAGEAAGYFEEVLKRDPNHPKRAAIEAQIAALRSGSAATTR